MGAEPLRELGKALLLFGAVLAGLGLLLMLGTKLPGRLGDPPIVGAGLYERPAK